MDDGMLQARLFPGRVPVQPYSALELAVVGAVAAEGKIVRERQLCVLPFGEPDAKVQYAAFGLFHNLMTVSIQFIKLQTAGSFPLRVAVFYVIREARIGELFTELILDLFQLFVRDGYLVGLQVGLELFAVRNGLARTGACDDTVSVNNAVEVGTAFGREGLDTVLKSIDLLENGLPVPMRVGYAVVIDFAGKHRIQACAFFL